MSTKLDEPAVRRVMRTSRKICAEDWQRGEAFYPAHREWITRVAAEHDCDGDAIAASARASVRTFYGRECLTLLALLRGEEKPSGILGQNWSAAALALNAGLDAALVGDAPKVRCYDAAIRGDRTRAVIDTHIARFLGYAQPRNHREYTHCERIIQAAARRLGIEARTLQAALWYHVRGVKPADTHDPREA